MRNIYIVFKGSYAEEVPNAAMEALFVVDISSQSDELLFYKTFQIKRLPDQITGQWRDGQIGFKLPEITPQMHKLKCYIWNKGRMPMYLDHLSIDFYTYAP
jgi:hypothetical protein